MYSYRTVEEGIKVPITFNLCVWKWKCHKSKRWDIIFWMCFSGSSFFISHKSSKVKSRAQRRKMCQLVLMRLMLLIVFDSCLYHLRICGLVLILFNKTAFVSHSTCVLHIRTSTFCFGHPKLINIRSCFII